MSFSLNQVHFLLLPGCFACFNEGDYFAVHGPTLVRAATLLDDSTPLSHEMSCQHLLTARNTMTSQTMPCCDWADSQVTVKAWITLVTAICEGFPTRPHKEGSSIVSRPGTTMFPLADPLSVKTIPMLQLQPCPQPPSYLLNQPLPAPTTHTLDMGSGDMFF